MKKCKRRNDVDLIVVPSLLSITGSDSSPVPSSPSHLTAMPEPAKTSKGTIAPGKIMSPFYMDDDNLDVFSKG